MHAVSGFGASATSKKLLLSGKFKANVLGFVSRAGGGRRAAMGNRRAAGRLTILIRHTICVQQLTANVVAMHHAEAVATAAPTLPHLPGESFD